MSIDVTEYQKNQETSELFNREPGIAVIPGSPYAKYMSQFESSPVGGFAAGNPYKYRPFPKMLYHAERVNGAPVCMGAPPDPYNPAYSTNPALFERDVLAAQRFTEKCQRIVNDEREFQKAMEGGWRESPEDAVAFLIQRDKNTSKLDAHREYEDRNLSDSAKAEIMAEREARGGDPIAEMPEKRRGRKPRTNAV